MGNLTEEDIFLPGTKLIATKLDFNDPKLQAWLKDVKKEQLEILKLGEGPSREQMRKTVITI